jgi:hypothetical protein
MVHGHEESDFAIVAVKPANKVAHPAVEQSAMDQLRRSRWSQRRSQGECGPAKHVPGA